MVKWLEALRVVELALIKRRLKWILEELDEHYDSYDCGQSIVDIISPRGPQLKRTFKRLYTRALELDPSAPPMPLWAVNIDG